MNVLSKYLKQVAQIKATKDGGVLTVSNKDGQPIASIASDAGNSGVIQTVGEEGRITSRLP